MSPKPKVALLTNAPAPYRVPFLNELAKHCDLRVFFDTLREQGREWAIDTSAFAFDWTATKGMSVPLCQTHSGYREPRVVHFPLTLLLQLDRFRPDVVVSAELGARTAAAAAYCRLRSTRLIAWWEGTAATEAGRGRSRHALRTALLRQCERAWCNGQMSFDSLVSYGVSRHAIDAGMIGIDTETWFDEVEAARIDTAYERSCRGLRGVVLMVCGSLAPRKGIKELLTAVSIVASERTLPAWSLLVVGSGVEQARVEAWATAHPSVPVSSAGYVQPRDLPRFFAIADLFVMPSLEDCWGVVSLEALVAGVPQVTSSLAGAAPDVVQEETIGSTVDPRDAHALAEQIVNRIRSGSAQVPAHVRREAVARWSPAACADRAFQSIARCVDKRTRHVA